MHLIDRDPITFFGSHPRVCAVDQSAQDGGFGGEGDDRAGDVGGYEGGDCGVDVGGVGAEEGGDDEEDFAGGVCGGVAICERRGEVLVDILGICAKGEEESRKFGR